MGRDPADPSNPVLPEPILPSSPNPSGNDTAAELGAIIHWSLSTAKLLADPAWE